ncbi:MAG TPA: response regulator [Candidatus Krumholzibacteria bacterium]|nr:response regulator [Candidatus Krumholzibacteria bacterium]
MATNNNRSLRLIVIDSDPAARSYIKRWLGGKGVRVVGESDEANAGLRLARGLQPDIVLLELSSKAAPAMELIKRIHLELPSTSIILSAHDASPQLILSCIRAGAQEFVARPIDGAELDKAIEHVRHLSGVTLANKSRGKVISVLSSKGGIGATSITANLGVALAQRAKVVLVDMSFPFGDLGVMLDAPSRYSLTDAMVDGAIEETKLRSVLVSSNAGVHLLNVTASPEVSEEITRRHMVELVGTLSTMFDYVLIDIGRQMDDRTVEVLELSDDILLVSALDLPTIRNTVCFAGILGKLNIDRDKTHVVLNRFHKKSRLSLDDVETMIDGKVFWSIPNDYAPMSMAIDRGVPAVKNEPRSKVAKSFVELADRIHALGADHPDAVQAVG